MRILITGIEHLNQKALEHTFDLVELPDRTQIRADPTTPPGELGGVF